MTINPALTELNSEIDRLLHERRPDRYTVRGDDQDSPELTSGEVETTNWLDQVADEVDSPAVTEAVRQIFLRSLVGQREGQKTRKGNKALRDLDRHGVQPLTYEWVDEPIAVVTRVIQPGERVKVIEERVALRAATPKDLRDFATEERRRAAKEFGTRNLTCENAEWLADQLVEVGAGNVRAWIERENDLRAGHSMTVE
jgi:hypothetical protein